VTVDDLLNWRSAFFHSTKVGNQWAPTTGSAVCRATSFLARYHHWSPIAGAPWLAGLPAHTDNNVLMFCVIIKFTKWPRPSEDRSFRCGLSLAERTHQPQHEHIAGVCNPTGYGPSHFRPRYIAVVQDGKHDRPPCTVGVEWVAPIV
jgi:hypothetical protein